MCTNFQEEADEQIDESISDEVMLDTVVVEGKTQSQCIYNISLGAITTISMQNVTIDMPPITPIVKDEIKTLPLIVFPNPARDMINIKYTIAEEGFSMLTLFNINGQKIADLFSVNESTTGVFTIQYDVKTLPSGMYLLVLLNNEQKEVFRVNVTH